MKFETTTTMLQVLVSKAIKGAGFNKLLPITSMIGIYVDDKINLYTTDGSNYLEISGDVVKADDFDITVDADTFAKLVSKLTSDTVTLEVKDNILIITGNGTYKLPLQMSDDGTPLKFPNRNDNNLEVETIGELPQAAINYMVMSLKPSLSTNVSSVYSNYFVGEFLASTDRAMMCICDRASFDKPMLFSREFVDLLALAGSDVKLGIRSCDDMIIALADGFVVQAKPVDGVDDYNVDGLKKLLNLELNSFCRVNKKALLSLLDRLSIFVGAYDDESIQIHFTDGAMEISSMSSDGVESIDYMEYSNFKEHTVKINVNRLITLLKAYASDFVDIYYGDNMCIKFVDGHLTELLALMR